MISNIHYFKFNNVNPSNDIFYSIQCAWYLFIDFFTNEIQKNLRYLFIVI